jgi:hypothetical protein
MKASVKPNMHRRRWRALPRCIPTTTIITVSELILLIILREIVSRCPTVFTDGTLCRKLVESEKFKLLITLLKSKEGFTPKPIDLMSPSIFIRQFQQSMDLHSAFRLCYYQHMAVDVYCSQKRRVRQDNTKSESYKTIPPVKSVFLRRSGEHHITLRPLKIHFLPFNATETRATRVMILSVDDGDDCCPR